MAKQDGKKFAWVIRNFSSLQSENVYSDPVQIGDCKWHLAVHPKGDNVNHLSLFLEVADFESLPSGWGCYVKLKLTIVKQVSEKRSVVKETYRWFDEKALGWGFKYMLPLTKLHDEKEGFLVNGGLIVAAEVEVLDVIGTLDESEDYEEVSELLSEAMETDDEEMSDVISKNQQVEESIDVNGFKVLPSQVESARRIFERHPDIAVEFHAKNQHLRNACMSFLLSLMETLCLSLEELSNEDLVEADIALTYLKDAGFKVEWLEKKLEQVKEKKEKELLGLARLYEIEDHILKLKKKCSEMDALAEKEKADLSATRTSLSLDDLV